MREIDPLNRSLKDLCNMPKIKFMQIAQKYELKFILISEEKLQIGS